MSITHDEELPVDSRGQAQLDDTSVTVSVTTNELDYWLGYFLRHSRDGAADAPRIEFELTADRTNIGRGLTIAFVSQSVKPPKTEPIEDWLFPET